MDFLDEILAKRYFYDGTSEDVGNDNFCSVKDIKDVSRIAFVTEISEKSKSDPKVIQKNCVSPMHCVLCVTESGKVEVYDVETGVQWLSVQTHEEAVSAVKVSSLLYDVAHHVELESTHIHVQCLYF